MPGLIRLWLPLLLMLSWPAAGALFEGGGGVSEGPAVKVVVDAPAAVSGGRLRFEGGPQQSQSARLEFELPPVGDQRWVVWLARDPLDEVRLSGKDWTPPPAGFFSPPPSEGAFPAGFGFALPRGATGPQALRMELQGSVRSAPVPRVLSEQDVLRYVGRETALAFAVYAALATLLIATLALYSAVRDPLFLLYAVYVAAAAGLMAAANGHLFAIPGLRVFGMLGARAFWLTMLAFNAIALAMLLRLAETRGSGSPWLRRMEWLPWVMGVLALLPLVPLPGIASGLQAVATSAWLVAMPVGLWAMFDGARRGIPMVLATGVALLVLLASAGAHEAMHRGWLADGVLTRHGYQFALVLMSVILFVGLCNRIAMVRQRLDDETSARRDSEDRLRIERSRSGFAQLLQDELRAAPANEIAARALRLLCRHACELLRMDDAVVLAHGYLGNDQLLVQSRAGQASPLAQAVLAARSVVRAHAQHREPIHVRIAGDRVSEAADAPQYAIVPLRLTSPAWAALVLQVQAEQGLAADELRALVELAQVAVLQADEAHAALQLRRTAEFDALTGTMNRRSLDQLLVAEFKSGQAQARPLSVLFIDIDWFKRVNDEHGHACGDHCLRAIAATLRGELRPSDALGRYGGEEFLVVLPGQDAAAARIVAERLRHAVEQTAIEWGGKQLALTISIGMSARRDGDGDVPALLERADKALYAAKHEGRNRVCVAPAAFS